MGRSWWTAACLRRDGEIFAIEVERDGATTVLVLRGELDLAGAPRFTAALAEAIAAGHMQVALELGQLEFIDASSVGLIERSRRQLRALGGELTLRNPPVYVRRVIELCATLTGLAQGLDRAPAPIEILSRAEDESPVQPWREALV